MSADDLARQLGYACLELDDIVRDYRRVRRFAGVPEDAVMQGVHREQRMAAFDRVNELTVALRKAMNDKSPR